MTDNEDSTPAATALDQTTEKNNLADLSADPSHVFDQTNGIADGLEGDEGDVPADDSGTLIDPTLSDDETRQRPDEDGRLS